VELKEGKDSHMWLRQKFCDVITDIIEKEPDTPVSDLIIALNQLTASMVVSMDDDIGESVTWYIQNFITACEQMAEHRGLKMQMMVSHEGGKADVSVAERPGEASLGGPSLGGQSLSQESPS